MIIGITDTLGSEDKFRKYSEWLRGETPEVEIRVLSYVEDNLAELSACDALLLSGGHDVDPRLYGGPESHPAITDVDRKRDDFERRALKIALKNEVPVLGICRGMQLANVYFGGTLLPDIQEAGYENHRSGKDAERRHEIVVDKQSSFFALVGTPSGEVNTSHHQSVDRPGKGLRIAARSGDGVIEAMEYDVNTPGGFFLLVQWHPERMKDIGNPFTTAVRKAFISSVRELNDK